MWTIHTAFPHDHCEQATTHIMADKNTTQEQKKREEYEKGRQQAADAIDGAKDAANKAAGLFSAYTSHFIN